MCIAMTFEHHSARGLVHKRGGTRVYDAGSRGQANAFLH